MIRRALLAVFVLLTAATLRAADQVVSFSTYSYTFHENDGTGAVTVNRTGDPSVSCSVGYRAFVNDLVTIGIVTFAPNEMSKVIAVPIPNDDVYDTWSPSDQDYNIQLQSAPGVTFQQSYARIILIEAEPIPRISIASLSVPEGNVGTNNVRMTLTLSGPLKRAYQIPVYAFGGTATPGYDFYVVPNSGLLVGLANLAPRQTSGEFVIQINGDDVPEPDETMILYASFGGTFTSSGILTILNDDYFVLPEAQRIRLGSTGSVNMTTTVPTLTADHLELSRPIRASPRFLRSSISRHAPPTDRSTSRDSTWDPPSSR